MITDRFYLLSLIFYLSTIPNQLPKTKLLGYLIQQLKHANLLAIPMNYPLPETESLN